jgi:hypothetical protein
MKGNKISFAAVAICLTIAALISVRSALADALLRCGKLDALLWLEPDHAAARLDRAAPGDLEAAAAAAPTRSAALIELAMAAESRGDLPAARRYLEAAIRRDATFDPRWAMINFLMRHGDSRDVLDRAAPAAAIYEGDLTALFDLCLRTGASPDQVYRTIVPLRPKAQREFLELMIRRGKQLDAVPAALRLADLAQPRDRDLLFALCDQLLEAGAGGKAAQLWKTLPRFGAAGGHCLDWKRQTVDGIVVIEAGESVVRLELSGRQPELTSVLRRMVIVEPGRRYHLRALAGGDDTMKKAVEWRWNGAAAGTGTQTDIEVEAGRQICELELVIRRRPGERPAEGELEITNIRLEPKAASLERAVARGPSGRQARGVASHHLPGVAVLHPHHHEVQRRRAGGAI